MNIVLAPFNGDLIKHTPQHILPRDTDHREDEQNLQILVKRNFYSVKWKYGQLRDERDKHPDRSADTRFSE